MFKRLLFLATTSLVIFGCSKSTTQETVSGSADVAVDSAAVDVSVDVTESVDVTPVSAASDVSSQD